MFKKGDTVVRYLSSAKIKAYEGPLHEEDDNFVYIGTIEEGWKFDKEHGYEVDEDLGWGVVDTSTTLIQTGSWIEHEPGSEKVQGTGQAEKA